MVRDQIQRLEDPALKCACTVHTEIINIMQIWTTFLERKMQRFPNLTAAISSEVTELLSERHLVAQDLLKHYVEVQASFIKTVQMDFNTEMHELLKKNLLSKNELHSVIPVGNIVTTGPGALMSVIGDGLTEIQKMQCTVVRQLVQNYFQIVKTAFQDYCPKVIAHSIVYYMESNIHRRLVSTDAVVFFLISIFKRAIIYKMFSQMEKLYTPMNIDQLVQESVTVADHRKQAKEKLQVSNN